MEQPPTKFVNSIDMLLPGPSSKDHRLVVAGFAYPSISLAAEFACGMLRKLEHGTEAT
jgi:hypothetical protein